MRYRSLRFRTTVALLLLVSVSSGLFALAAFYVSDRIEDGVLDQTLQREFQEFEQLYRLNPAQGLPHSASLQGYLVRGDGTDVLPRTLRELEPGTYHDLDIEGRAYHVLVRDMDGGRLYLAHDITRIEQRETRFAVFLIVSVLLASAAAVWAGYLLSRRVIAPVTDLAGRVSHLHPGQPHERLADAFADSELKLIAESFDQFLSRLGQFIEREHVFTQDASHELRTPLAVINSASELLLADPGLPHNLRPALRRIQRASRQMNRLTRALLVLARESGAPAEDTGQCRADAVITEVVDSQRQLQPDLPVELRLDIAGPLTLFAPAELLEIVVINLLQNALAHTRQGHVRIGLAHGVLTVEDTGSGIQPEDLPRIFERDYRGTGSSGIGRGLDLVRRICERLGWRIEVASELNWGTRFEVHLRTGPDANHRLRRSA